MDGDHAYMSELYVNEIREGVSILLRLFIDDCIVLQKLNEEIFQ